ncbi:MULTISPECIES: tellurite resistance TerB family protein [unclassified Pseudomonas]|uniref:tellurite resistance TerB family protein n=1 Tax=unclassified Pseudomonas TaxID=196821 RepID=UPI00244B3303|nr:MULTISPECIES: tellurite resistance TerB family protein [unclassified Pseudomonas]MDH0892870.1 tellurite resistance TerB family protein [Pseudomonas sp. GD03875]MDH1064656.1 tellurite resistance TerB family protein [Pseudomonas sp. GD03985]
MNTRGLLDQLLKSGQDLLQQKSGSSSSAGLGGLLGSVTGAGKAGGGDLGSLLKGAGGGALAAGALGMLLGNKSARKLGSKALTYGGLAALGVIAYKAYGNWQAQQQGGAQPLVEPQTVDRLPAPQAEVHSQAILKALVAAAKADGHVDARERQLIEEQIGALAGDPELVRWLEAELNKPLDPGEVARAASTPEIAAEMYIASVLMVDEEHFMERAYLEELARQLKLEPSLKAELEAQVRRELVS